jgi:hypothetical protein
MSNTNQENIEARLATYVDGDLEPADKLEIEKHLQQNPQYRRLLEDLRRQRDMLRALPREAAPPEVTESFSSQFERAALLGISDSPQDEPRMRIGAWPRIIAAAAIVLLTVGLAAIVMFVLPDRNGRFATKPMALRNPIVATSNPSMPADQPDENVAAALRRASVDERLAEAKGDRGNRQYDKYALLDSLGRPADRELDAVAQSISVDPRLKSLLASETAELGGATTQPTRNKESVVFVVRADNAQLLESRLAHFFSERNIDWKAAPEPTMLAINATTALRKEADATGVLGTTDQRDRDALASTRNLDPAAGGGGAQPNRDRFPTNAPTSAPAVVVQGKQQAQEGIAAKPTAPAQPLPGAAPAVSQVTRSDLSTPVATAAAAGTPDDAKHNDGVRIGGAQSALAAAGKTSVFAATNPSLQQNLYIARGLSRNQARELADYLGGSDVPNSAGVAAPDSDEPRANIGSRKDVAVAEIPASESEQIMRRTMAVGDAAGRLESVRGNKAIDLTPSRPADAAADAPIAPASTQTSYDTLKAEVASKSPSVTRIPGSIGRVGVQERERIQPASKPAATEPTTQVSDGSIDILALDVVIVVQSDAASSVDFGPPAAGASILPRADAPAPATAPTTQPSSN